MRKQRHNYTPEEKVAILKRHLVERVPVSDLCDKYQLQPTVFYHWQQQFFEKGAAAFTQGKDPKRKDQRLRDNRLSNSSGLKVHFRLGQNSRVCSINR
jgi:transposase-like protein